jgi:hypothetical protein
MRGARPDSASALPVALRPAVWLPAVWLPAAWLLAAWLLVGAAWPGAARAQADPVPYGVVSLSVTGQAFDQLLPWIKATERSVSGNAVVVEGHKLVTTADLVKAANLIEVRKFGRYPDYPARALLVDYEQNLALLTVDDPEFWVGLRPLPLAPRPVPSGHFAINRWRSNGRFERGTGEVVDFVVGTSPFGLLEFPIMRATTAVGGLGWSEVLTSEGEVIGLITSHDGQQLRATPSDRLRLLVEAAGREPFGGFAHRGFAWQQLNQEHLRASLGLQASDTGVLVRRVFHGGTGAAELRAEDILHRVNGYDVDPEGRIEHPTYGLMLFTVAFNESLAPTLPVEIERAGKRMRLELKRLRFDADDYRIPPPQFGSANDYEAFGGLVLQELSVSYLQAWGGEWRNKAPARLVIEYGMHPMREPEAAPERVVFISRVLPDPSNLGYGDVDNAIVRSVNGRPLRSLADFREAIRQPRGGYHEIELLPGAGRGMLVFRQSELAAINARVRTRYGIPARDAAR